MTPLDMWAAKWNIGGECLRELQVSLGLSSPWQPSIPTEGFLSESYVQSAIRLEASRQGVVMFRNNVGALKDKDGRTVRFGLANDSQAVNKVLKSGDLIGIRRLLIEPRHVGAYIGQFVSRECKPVGWRYTGTEREVAQANWIKLIVANGGDACFATGVGTL